MAVSCLSSSSSEIINILLPSGKEWLSGTLTLRKEEGGVGRALAHQMAVQTRYQRSEAVEGPSCTCQWVSDSSPGHSTRLCPLRRSLHIKVQLYPLANGMWHWPCGLVNSTLIPGVHNRRNIHKGPFSLVSYMMHDGFPGELAVKNLLEIRSTWPLKCRCCRFSGPSSYPLIVGFWSNWG